MAEIPIVDDLPCNSDKTVLKKIIQFNPRAKVTMITGWANKSIGERVFEAGAKAFIEEPNAQKDLLRVTEEMLKG